MQESSRKLIVILNYNLSSHRTRSRRLNDENLGFNVAAHYYLAPFGAETMGDLSHIIMVLTKGTNTIRELFRGEQVTAKFCPNDIKSFEMRSKRFVKRWPVLWPKKEQLQSKPFSISNP